MAETHANKRRIAKNTLYLYFRMILIMGVTLFTSRVVLDKLGVEDYGLFQVVGGVVGMLSFLNGTLSIGTSRFLTFELGTGNSEKLKRTFSTAFYSHLILAVIIIFLMETVGLWFMYNKLVIPDHRFNVCLGVFQISLFTTFMSITQVPYTATIMAHERMGVYAYISIFEALAKLGICYLLYVIDVDKLVLYAILIAVVQFLVVLSYRIYAIRHFEETHVHLIFDKEILRSLLGFSGWNITANLAGTLKLQGVLVLINIFFSSVVVASQAIANQVAQAMMQFVNSFRTAINPQIIKSYAAGQKEESKKLTLETTVYCFDLVLLLGLPAIVVMDKLMHLWLVEVPEYAVVFTQWIIAQQIMGTFSASFYTPMMAANKMKVNSIASVFTGIGEFIVLYVLFRIGLGPMWILYLGMLASIIYSFGIKPYVLHKDIDYTWREMGLCYWICAKVLFLSCVLSIPSVFFLGDDIPQTLLKALIAALAVVISSYVFMSSEMKGKLKLLILSKFRK